MLASLSAGMILQFKCRKSVCNNISVVCSEKRGATPAVRKESQSVGTDTDGVDHTSHIAVFVPPWTSSPGSRTDTAT